MLLTIIITAAIIGILFWVVVASLIAFIYHNAKKNDNAKKISLKILITSVIIWILLIVINIVLLITFLYNNKEAIFDKSVRIPAEMMGKGLALTFQNFEKSWDKNRLEQLKNLQISPSSMNYKIKDGTRIYDIELIFDNNSPPEVTLYFDNLTGNNYLVVCDKDDFVYLLDKTFGKIPFGKSKFKFTVTVPKDVDITHARFIDTVVHLK